MTNNMTNETGQAVQDNIITVNNLSVQFEVAGGLVSGLKDVSVTVPRGQIVGVVGESGSGKSTLIYTLTQLMADNAIVASGTAEMDGADLLKKSPREMQALLGDDIAMIFQDPMTTLNPVFSIEKQMTDIQYRQDLPYQEKRQRAIDALDRVGIPNPELRLPRYPHEFSGGQLQRISIAMALMARPKVLIADEPTTALDASLEVQIIELLKELQAEIGCSMIFVSHHLGVVGTLCDYTVVMYHGDVVEQGPTREVFNRPQHSYTQRLLACDPARIKERSKRLPTMNSDGLGQIEIPAGSYLASQLEQAGPDTGAGKQDQPLLNIDALRIRFPMQGKLAALLSGNKDPYLHAVKGVSLTLDRGETLAIVGESGSGKTTVAQAILGLNQPWSGAIHFQGRDLLSLSARERGKTRRDIAMMFQDPISSLSPRMKISDLITEPLVIHGLPFDSREQEARRLLQIVGLPLHFADRYPHQLSGGQARRVGVARALAQSPKLIVADEPTAGLDVSVQGEILNLLNQLQEDLGIAILIITHNLNIVRHVADRTLIMNMGDIVEQGDTDTIFADPQHAYTRQLLEANIHPDPV
ncbi:dipeptide ABC transporter ATP-binding protein [Aliamphritea hakodatensis]|uniref:dipeptide ABC transporter ATP-binding protein n=1 Tax=Aliamphritea hakodatensis TaxID=2895352 RepID=UPI0022FDA6FA|nr:ABC transporter ATP-binding protein [Aliamphritea hakodatensis]